MGDTAFNWRNHVIISEDFKPEQRALIEASFDRLAQFHDREGEQLIRAASARVGGPFVVMPGELNSAEIGRLNLNFDQLGSSRYSNDPQNRGPSLLGTMVHELYHMVDPAVEREEEIAGRTMATLVRPDGSKQYLPELSALISDANDIFFRLRRGSESERNEIAEYLEKEYPRNPRLQEYAAMIRTTSNAEWIERFSNAGVTNGAGTLLHEQRATEYTDALMAKNVGDAEPQRGDYAAMRAGERYAIDNVPALLPTAQANPGFDGPGAVDVRPVGVKPPQNLLPEGFNLTALRGCTTDGQHYGAGETGQLAATVANDKAKDTAPVR